MNPKRKLSFFERFSNKVTSWAGSSYAFFTAFSIVLIWASTGPLFDFSETWQLVINTGTTVITFLMVFLIQKSQNKDNKAIQLKLNELIAADERASNRMVDLEDITEEELDRLHKFYEKLSDLSQKEDDIHNSHSIDAAVQVNERKHGKKRTISSGMPEMIRDESNHSFSKKKVPGKQTEKKKETHPVKKNGK